MASDKPPSISGDKPYDSSIKSLIRLDPKEWLQFLGVAVGDAPVETLNADLSSLNLSADGLLKVVGNIPYGVHVECESGAKGNILADRLLTYNVFAERVTGLPFQSFAVLMTPKAHSPQLTGKLEKHLPDGRVYLTFQYDVIRLYELSPEIILNAGLSVVPLALLGDLTNADLPQISEKQEQELLAATYVLTGARYSRAFAHQILKGALRNVFDVRDSDTFQEILEIGLAEGREKGLTEGREKGIVEGRAEGRAEAERQTIRDTILRLGTKRFGMPSPEVVERLVSLSDKQELTERVDRLLEAESWDEFWQD